MYFAHCWNSMRKHIIIGVGVSARRGDFLASEKGQRHNNASYGMVLFLILSGPIYGGSPTTMAARQRGRLNQVAITKIRAHTPSCTLSLLWQSCYATSKGWSWRPYWMACRLWRGSLSPCAPYAPVDDDISSKMKQEFPYKEGGFKDTNSHLGYTISQSCGAKDGAVSKGNFPAPITCRFSHGCVDDAYVVRALAPPIVSGTSLCVPGLRQSVFGYGLGHRSLDPKVNGPYRIGTNWTRNYRKQWLSTVLSNYLTILAKYL